MRITALAPVPRAAAATAIGVGGIVLLGWVFGMSIVTTVLPGLSSMKANTATAFILAGVSLWLSDMQYRAGWPRRLGATCAGLVGAIGLLTISEYLLSTNLGVDQLLIRDRITSGGAFPGRMGINTALAFALLAVALVRRETGLVRTRSLVEGSTVAAAVIAATALIGYAFSATSLTGIASATQMALHTALLFLVLCVGVLARDRDGPLMRIMLSDGPGGQVVRRILPIMLGVMLVLGWLRLRGQDVGLYGTQFGTSIMVLGSMVALSIAVFRSAARLDRDGEALRTSEQRFRELADNVREVFFVTDPASGRALYVSPAYEVVVGRSREHAYATPLAWIDVLHPEDRERMLAAEHATRISGKEVGSEFRILRPDGTIRWIRRRASPVKDASGQVVRVVGIAEDITELKRTEEQLLQAQKMEAVGRLAGGVAHDFNNVLTAILGYTEMLIDEVGAQSTLRDDLEEIRTATGRAAALTRQLLAFSRQQILQPVVLNSNDLIMGLEKMLRRLIGEDVNLRTATAADLGNVRADPGQVEQVLMNLVVNARDAMPKGGNLTIETANVELDAGYVDQHWPTVPGPYVMIVVSDTGSGISPEVRKRIFEPFFTTKEQGKGTGLGLSTVYGIVKQSGGYIWVYSEPGQGTTFKIYLPRVHESIEPLAPPPKAEGTLAGTETILLAEDDAALQRLTGELLMKLGYTVLTAGEAEQALALARESQRPIDLLISDVVMPGASGRDLARRLAQLRPTIRVLYTSGYTDDAIVHHGMLEPGLDFLQKPFTPLALARKVREVLDRPT